MADTIGMMNKAYAVPRGEILRWANEALDINLSKIEQFGTGAVFCQLFDIIFPGTIQLNRISWKAKTTHEYINNFKLLQKGFEKKQLKKHIEVLKLSNCKYQDNLEFSQWFKYLFDTQGGDKDPLYNANEKRGGVPIEILGEKMGQGVVTKKSVKSSVASKFSVASKLDNQSLKFKSNLNDLLPGNQSKILKDNILPDKEDRPIKKMSKATDISSCKLSKSEDQVKQIINLIQNDGNDSEILKEIRNIFGIKISSKNQETPNFEIKNQSIPNNQALPQQKNSSQTLINFQPQVYSQT